jgi:phage tail protein X
VKANPQLSDLNRLPPGSAVLVPDTTAGPDAAETVPPAGLSRVNVSRIVAAVATLGDALGAASSGATAQADTTLALLKDRTLKAAIAKNPDLAQRVGAISDGAKAALKDVGAQKTMLQNGIAQLQSDLSNFLKLEPMNLQSATQPMASLASQPAKAAPAPAPTAARAPAPAATPTPAPKSKARRTKAKR